MPFSYFAFNGFIFVGDSKPCSQCKNRQNTVIYHDYRPLRRLLVGAFTIMCATPKNQPVSQLGSANKSIQNQ